MKLVCAVLAWFSGVDAQSYDPPNDVAAVAELIFSLCCRHCRHLDRLSPADVPHFRSV